MSEQPFMQLYVADYLGDTRHLTTEQHGAYLLLLMTMWRAGGTLPNDAGKLARIAGITARRWHIVAPDVMAFFTVEGSSITQKRLKREHQKAVSKSEKRSAIGKLGGKAKSLKNHETGLAKAKQLLWHSSEPELEKKEEEANASLSEPKVSDPPKPKRKKNSYPPEFEASWQAYPTDPNMSKSDAFAAWSKLDGEDRGQLLASLPAYREYCRKNPDYRPKHMVGYIRSRRFEGHAGLTSSGDVTSEAWAKRLAFARGQGKWPSSEWGPAPGKPGCKAPRDLLEPSDGVGWAEWVHAAA